ncbi:MAG: filamentous hemagglutinin family outer membrane protein, partial [Rhizobacter sp.]|nr:filamentous hemagglutinin family outer membrane protein [Rhizobacter sp.]
GQHAITQGSLAGNANYEVTAYTAAVVDVAKRQIELTADAQSKVYGDADPTLSYQIGGNGLATWDTAATAIVGALAAPTGANATAGLQSIARGTLDGNDNYSVTAFTGNTLTVARRSISVAADAQAKTYGDADPALTYQVGDKGLASWDTQATAFNGALSTPTGAAATAGAQAIVQGTLAANANYEVSSFTGNTVNVAKRSIVVTADNVGRLEGGDMPVLSFSVGDGGLASWDTLASAFSGTLAADPAGLPGTTKIGRGTLVASSNYDIGSFIEGNLVVIPVTRPTEAGTVENTLPAPAQMQQRVSEAAIVLGAPIRVGVDASGDGPGSLTTVGGGFAAAATAPAIDAGGVGGAGGAVTTGPATNSVNLGTVSATQGAVSYSIAPISFAAVDASSPLTYLAVQADGNALPSWLSFDPSGLTLSGQAPAGFEGRVLVSVTATDANGVTHTVQVEVLVEKR